MAWTIICATNNEKVLNSCLLGSPGVRTASGVILQRGFASAAAAYNAGIEKADTDVLVFPHQDVYLPENWPLDLERALDALSTHDPNWAVLGIWGVRGSEEEAGNLYCTGLGRRLGRSFDQPTEVRSLDESLLVLRKSSGVRFDESMPGYHFYGTDICLEAASKGMKAYAISAFCIHNTNGYNLLPWEFWKCYLRMRRKWKSQLPIVTPCARITRWCWPMLSWNARRWVNITLKRHHPGKRVGDPGRLYQESVAALAGQS